MIMDALRPCPDSALLAAFIDGTLGDYERTAVVSHLSDCAQCRAVALTVAEFRELTASDAHWHTAVPPAPLGETRVHRWARAKTRAPTLALVAVATIAAIALPLLYLLPSWSARQAVATLVDAAEGQRPLEARVTGGFAYAAPQQISPTNRAHAAGN